MARSSIGQFAIGDSPIGGSVIAEAEGFIADLDRALALYGEDVILRRLALSGGVQTLVAEIICRAVVRQYQPADLVGGIIQGDSLMILSPSEIISADWPGTVTGPGDKRVPRKGDQVSVQGIARTAQAATPFYVAGTLVRLELQIRG